MQRDEEREERFRRLAIFETAAQTPTNHPYRKPGGDILYMEDLAFFGLSYYIPPNRNPKFRAPDRRIGAALDSMKRWLRKNHKIKLTGWGWIVFITILVVADAFLDVALDHLGG